MAKEILSAPGSKSAWQDGERFTARLLTVSKRKGKKGPFNVLSFKTSKGEVIERNAGMKWDELLTSKAVKVGEVFEVEAFEEVPTKKGNRFRPFSIVRLSTSDVPKQLRIK